MGSYTAKRVNDMQASFGGGFVKVRAELGLSSFGVQVIRMPAENTSYPEHDHAEDGQEELYAALEGDGWLEIEGERVEIDRGMLVRVGPGTKRKLFSGPNGLSALVVGGAPGEVYRVSPVSELDAA
jgi:mannose-6-phosphate isomerase-like protein (cupin superfamily)